MAMEEEGEYDVRAVEARLARMEAARRMRAGTSKPREQAQRETPVVHAVADGKGHMQQRSVGDFELCEMDSSASDSDDCDSVSTSSASDDEAFRPQEDYGKKEKKMRLKDSLDLSMSMSMAWPQDAAKVPKGGAVMRDTGEKPAKKCAVQTHFQTAPETSSVCDRVTGDREDLFAGKLIQRRRELERQATRESEQAAHGPPHRTQSRQLDSTSEPNAMVPTTQRVEIPEPEKPRAAMAGSKLGGMMPSRLVKPTDACRGKDPIGKGRHQMVERPPEQPQVRMPIKTQDASQTANKATAPRSHGVPSTATATQVVIPTKSDDKILRREPFAAEAARPMESTPAVQVPHPVQVTERPKGTFVKDPIPSHPPAIPLPKRAVAFTVAQTTTTTTTIKTVPATAAPPADVAKVGYSRGGSSNQQPAPAVVPKPVAVAVVSSKNDPQEDPEDLIDDLFTAEELRLRESLDKLSSRLHSLATARETLTKTGKDSNNSVSDGKYASRKQSPANATSGDDDRRLGSYGGGAHARLHQPASPTTRVPNAKRSELSSGVHKARVRLGGTLVQDAGSAPTAEGGKHKVVVKKDLAHLLF